MKWTTSLVARLHGRTPSMVAQGAPLLSPPSKSQRPYSTASLAPILEQQPCESPITPIPDKPLHDDMEGDGPKSARSLRAFLLDEIDVDKAIAPLSAYCFMTGFIDAVSFSAMFVWCAFQTGNSVQLALALARLFNGQHDDSFHIADRQALCSLVAFVLGALVGRLGDKLGCKTRLWMCLGTFFQTVLTMIAAVFLWKSHSGSVGDNRGDPAWVDPLSFVTVACISASMGLQGIMGKRLGTQFTTTVVLTTTWCELMTEPELFRVRRLVPARDHKIVAILCLFLGGFVSRSLLDRIGSSATLGIGTGLRFAIAVWWLLLPAKKKA